jgi:hypothetical protein
LIPEVRNVAVIVAGAAEVGEEEEEEEEGGGGGGGGGRGRGGVGRRRRRRRRKWKWKRKRRRRYMPIRLLLLLALRRLRLHFRAFTTASHTSAPTDRCLPLEPLQHLGPQEVETKPELLCFNDPLLPS